LTANPDLKLKYVFEIVRHGARAPYINDPRFKREATEMLTPTGMRQRFLLGRYNYLKYSKDHDYDSLMTSNGIKVQSTDTYRTILSGYSEIAGMIY
jgi:hypothetical protein